MSSDAPTDADDTPWPDISYVTRSKYRDTVVEYLAGHGPATPSTISEGIEEPIANVSHALGQLRERGLVQLLVPEDVRKGRIYALTDRGEHIAGEIEEEMPR